MGDGWIKVAQNVHANRKVVRAAKELTHGDVDAMVGKLVRLWSWALDNAEDGDLTHVSDRQLCMVMSISTRPLTRVRTTLQTTHLIDPKLGVIHDWNEFSGALIDKRQKDRERKRQDRENARKLMGVSDGSHADSPMDSPMDTGPLSDGRSTDSPLDVHTQSESESESESRTYGSSLRSEPLATASALGKNGHNETEVERLRRLEGAVADPVMKLSIQRRRERVEQRDRELAAIADEPAP